MEIIFSQSVTWQKALFFPQFFLLIFGWIRLLCYDFCSNKTIFLPLEYLIRTGYRRLPSNGEEYFTCPRECGRRYKYKRNLSQHLRFECGREKQFQCHICSKCFAHKGSLKSHLLAVHQIVWKSFTLFNKFFSLSLLYALFQVGSRFQKWKLLNLCYALFNLRNLRSYRYSHL